MSEWNDWGLRSPPRLPIMDYRRLIVAILSLAILILLIVVFSAITRIPGGPQFVLLLQKSPVNATIFITIASAIITLASTLLGKMVVDTGKVTRGLGQFAALKRKRQEIEKLKDTDIDAYLDRMRQIRWREASTLQGVSTGTIEAEIARPSFP